MNTPLCCVFTFFSHTIVNFRSILTDRISQHCYTGHKSAVLNSLSPPPVPIPRLSSPTSLYLWHRRSSYPEAVNPHCVPDCRSQVWLFPEWKCCYIWTVSTVPTASHTMHQTHSSNFPRNEGVFWTPLWLGFYWLFFFFFFGRGGTFAWMLFSFNWAAAL